MRRLGYALAALTLATMLLHALIATVQNHPNAYDFWAYLLFISPATVVVLILGERGHRYAGWGFLIPAFGAEQAADYGLPSHWAYAVAFVLATVLAQVVPMWGDLPRTSAPARRLGPPPDD
jgi:hypothetical protein